MAEVKLLHFFIVESPGKHIGYGLSLFDTLQNMRTLAKYMETGSVQHKRLFSMHKQMARANCKSKFEEFNT